MKAIKQVENNEQTKIEIIAIEQLGMHCGECLFEHLLRSPLRQYIQPVFEFISHGDNVNINEVWIDERERRIEAELKYRHIMHDKPIIRKFVLQFSRSWAAKASMYDPKDKEKTTMKFQGPSAKEIKGTAKLFFDRCEENEFFYLDEIVHKKHTQIPLRFFLPKNYKIPCIYYLKESEKCAFCFEYKFWLILSPCCKSVGAGICAGCYGQNMQVSNKCWICRKQTEFCALELFQEIAESQNKRFI